MALATDDVQAAARTLAFRHAARIALLRRLAPTVPFDGRSATLPSQRLVVPQYEERDTHRLAAEVQISLIYSFDHGPHASGWWRNSDYDRCFHLSFAALNGSAYVDMPEIDRRAWPRAFFGDNVAMAWWEPPAAEGDPYRNAPASRYTHHVRLFIDRATGRPIVPAGEVYTLKPWPEGDSPEKVYR